ncbi:helix-turn-helix domain-containing protein [Kitasatospora sp. NPDC051914]|uniref:winged helix-turn-helix transcriptional regulator n=1 Tax=Kitasatospora sp. NPDC051914 TaxID=3154945 RepID=UPI0034237561
MRARPHPPTVADRSTAADRPAPPPADHPPLPPLTADFFADCADGDPRPPVRGSEKWGWKIMRCLEAGPRRFSELKVPLAGITPKVLAESLRAMERDGVVLRTAYDENPPRVEYALTPLGRSLFGPIDAACAWTREHLAEIRAARAAYGQRGGSILATAGVTATGGPGAAGGILDA